MTRLLETTGGQLRVRAYGKQAGGHCRILDLPSELRARIYSYIFPSWRYDAVKDRKGVQVTSPYYPLKRIHILLVSRSLHDDVTQYLYSVHVFRLFPLQDFSRMPTVKNIAPQYKRSCKAIELILGSSWTNPPSSWVVDEALGLHHMELVHTLDILLVCDPSEAIFEGFRVSKTFYTHYAVALVRDILKALPNLQQIILDSYSYVRREGHLVTHLMDEFRKTKAKVRWKRDGMPLQTKGVILHT